MIMEWIRDHGRAGRLREREPMAGHTTFRLGGPADLYYEADGAGDFCELLSLCAQRQVPVFVLGGGSNLLVSDRGIRGLVLRPGEGMEDCRIEGTVVRAGAGIRLSTLARRAAEANLSGLEFAEGIPGTLGGGLVMNAGAYGGELCQVVRRVWVTDAAGERRELDAGQMAFAYRDSLLQHQRLYALEAELHLAPGSRTAIQDRMTELSHKRRQSQPLAWPSAGSTFKRPAQGYAAALIDQAGLRGERIGDALVSEKHAGFIVNDGAATAADVLALMRRVQRVVYEKNGILLQPEVRCVGEFLPGELPYTEEPS